MPINIGDNFSYLGRKFLDNRQSFNTLAEMNACTDVPIGFITYCVEDEQRYEYTEDGWVEYVVGGKEEIQTSESEPTEENVSLWINTSDDIEIIEIARINDDVVASSTTWSSERIDDAIKNMELPAQDVIFTTDSLTVNSLGGIGANVDLNGLTVNEVLQKLLFPYIEPSINVSSTPNGGIFERGNIQTITNVRVSITKKSERIIRIEILDDGQVIAEQQGDAIANGGMFNYAVNVQIPSVNKQLIIRVTDNSNKQFTRTTNTFTYIYPYYWGVCDEGIEVDADLVKGLTKSVESRGTKTVRYTTNNQKMIFAYPSSYGSIASVLDPNNFDVTSTFVRKQLTIIGLDGTEQSYYVYENSPSTVSNFSMRFSY